MKHLLSRLRRLWRAWLRRCELDEVDAELRKW
jgi:hypothetical protein